jgi:4-hydroxymandelate oxidase
MPPVNVADYEVLAGQRLGAASWAHFNGASGDEHTHRHNARAWADLALWPRVLRPLAHGSSTTQLFGRRLAMPLLLAPVAHQGLAHPDAELASALAAASQGAGFVLSMLSSKTLEAVAAPVRDDADRGPLWFQLYWLHDRGFQRELLARVEAAGYEALVLTVDAPTHGARDRERRAGFQVPAGLQANLAGLPPRPTHAIPATRSALFDDLLLSAPSWNDLEALRGSTRLPILLKGVLRADDAKQAVALGVAGLVVSNHGGRTLDTAVSTARALPVIADAVAGAVPLLVDGGIRRGTDILKALALGASAVLVGRPQVHALVVGGAQGVAHMLRLLRDEFEIAMTLTGCARVADIERSLLAGDLR